MRKKKKKAALTHLHLSLSLIHTYMFFSFIPLSHPQDLNNTKMALPFKGTSCHPFQNWKIKEDGKKMSNELLSYFRIWAECQI